MTDATLNLSDNRQLYAFVIVSGLGGITSIAIAIINVIGTRQVKKVAEEAATAAKPTGNGFAREVQQSLSRIEGDLRRIETKVDHHIQSHADKEIADHVQLHH